MCSNAPHPMFRRLRPGLLLATLLLTGIAGCGGGEAGGTPGSVPTITSLIAPPVTENSTAVMKVTATDPQGDPLTFRIGGGADAALFTIDPVTHDLSFKSAPDFENPADGNGDNNYEVDVQATDGLSTGSLPLRVTVTDVNEPPDITNIPNGSLLQVVENRQGVFTVVATDPEGDPIKFGLSGGPDKAFISINPDTGAMGFRVIRDFETPQDADKNNLYDFNVTATDNAIGGANTATRSLTYEITDRNEAPTWKLFSRPNPRMQENSSAVDVSSKGGINPLQAIDPDINLITGTHLPVVYAIVGGEDQNLLTLDPVTGFLRFITPPDFEAPADGPINGRNTYNITVRATEQIRTPLGTLQQGTLSVSQPMTIHIENQVGDAPPAPVVTMLPGTKQLLFSWPNVTSATSYRLLENPDGLSGFTPLAAHSAITGTAVALDIPIHTLDWVNARYQVESCVTLPPPSTPLKCRASNTVSLTTGNMVSSIGYFKAFNTDPGDGLGRALAVSADGTTLAVGAPAEASADTGIDALGTDNSAAQAGAVYLFSKVAGNWVQQAYVKASNTDAGDGFGQAVSLSADGATLAVGAPGEASADTGINPLGTNNGSVNAGAVYLFGNVAGSWSQNAYIKASNTDAGDGFGQSVSLSADGATLAVGAPAEDSAGTGINALGTDNSATQSGAVYLFGNVAGSWLQNAYVKASNTDAGDGFGQSVALSADGATLAVGGPGEAGAQLGINGVATDNTAPGAGAVYLFGKVAGSWTQNVYIKASNTDAGDGFGQSVALSADGATLAVGAPGEDSIATGVNGIAIDNTFLESGAAYLFGFDGVTWTQSAYVKASNTDAGDGFGGTLAISGDGLSVAVGAAAEDGADSGVLSIGNNNAALDSGAAYLFTHGTGSWLPRTYVKAANSNAGDGFGTAVSLSTDGFTLAVGADAEAGGSIGIGGTTNDNSAPGAGAAYLY